MNNNFALMHNHSVPICGFPKAFSKQISRCLNVVALTIGFVSIGNASILTFDQTRQAGVIVPTISGNDLEADYGDRITGSPMNVPGGQFTYGNGGEGFTPNVVTHFFTGNGTGLSIWRDSYGDLTNVVFGNNQSVSLNVQLTADPGYTSDLYHFDLAGWNLADYNINAVRVLSGANTLFSLDNVLVQGADDGGPMHTAFDFATPLNGAELLIQIDHGNLAVGQQDNIGIDNIRFGQNPPAIVPLPLTAWLFGSGLMSLVDLSKHRKANR